MTGTIRTSVYTAILLGAAACTEAPSPSPSPATPSPATTAAPAKDEDYVGKGTIYDTQFKALHDAKQLGKEMNDAAARLDEQIDPDNASPQQ